MAPSRVKSDLVYIFLRTWIVLINIKHMTHLVKKVKSKYGDILMNLDKMRDAVGLQHSSCWPLDF